MNNNNKCLYRVQMCNNLDSYYYIASDINAIFECKFDYKENNNHMMEILNQYQKIKSCKTSATPHS